MNDLFYEVSSSVEGFFNLDDCEIYDEAMQVSLVRAGFPLVEVGAWLGRSTIYMAKLLLRHKFNNVFYTVDTFEGDPNSTRQIALSSATDVWKTFNSNLFRHGVRETVFPIKKPSVVAADLFEHSSLAFVFIDANHSFHEVKKDLNAWFPKILREGILSGHDYVMGEVRLAVDRFALEHSLKVQQKHNSWWIKVP